jgi:hypothetical protein
MRTQSRTQTGIQISGAQVLVYLCAVESRVPVWQEGKEAPKQSHNQRPAINSTVVALAGLPAIRGCSRTTTQL